MLEDCCDADPDIDCINIFSLYVEGENDQLLSCCENIDNIVYCEKCACSKYSPGTVENEEGLLFLLVSPNHYDSVTGTITPAAAQELFKRDLSTLRMKYSTADQVDYVRSRLSSVGKSDRSVNAASTFSAADIRGVLSESKRAFAALDTALEHLPSHCSVVSIIDAPNKTVRALLRTKVAALLQAGERDISNLFSG